MPLLMIPVLLAVLFSSPGLAQEAGPDKPAAANNIDSPTQVISRLQATLLTVMKEADKLGYAGRYQRLAPAVRESHDLAGIARVAVGQFWNQMDKAQQQAFLDTFSELSIASYASQLDSYSGESFQILSEEHPDQDNAVVHTLLTQPDAEDRHLDYMLRRTDQGWRIVNIIVEGISDLALKRAEYTSIIRREGVAVLLEKLQDKIAEYAQPNG